MLSSFFSFFQILPLPSVSVFYVVVFCVFCGPAYLSTSNSRVPHDGLWPLAGWCASLSRLRCPSPTGEDGHAVLLIQAFVRPPVGLDLLAQAAFTLNDFQQLAVSLCLCCGWGGAPTDRRLSLGELGELLELQLQMVLLLKLLELLL